MMSKFLEKIRKCVNNYLYYREFRNNLATIDRVFIDSDILETDSSGYIRFDLIFTLGLIEVYTNRSLEIVSVPHGDDELSYIGDDYNSIKFFPDNNFSFKKLMLFGDTMFKDIAESLDLDNKFFVYISGEEYSPYRYDSQEQIDEFESTIDSLKITSELITFTAECLRDLLKRDTTISYQWFLFSYIIRIKRNGYESLHPTLDYAAPYLDT